MSTTKEGAGEGQPVDLDHLSRQTFGDQELEREVLRLFERQSQDMLARLKEATNARSWAEAAHTLRGSALGVGAFEVAQAASTVEEAADDLDLLSLRAIASLARLEEAIREANAFIAELLNSAA